MGDFVFNLKLSLGSQATSNVANMSSSSILDATLLVFDVVGKEMPSSSSSSTGCGRIC